jgi:hypothetical protein
MLHLYRHITSDTVRSSSEARKEHCGSLPNPRDLRNESPKLCSALAGVRPLQPFPANAAVLESGRMIEGCLWPTRADCGPSSVAREGRQSFTKADVDSCSWRSVSRACVRSHAMPSSRASRGMSDKPRIGDLPGLAQSSGNPALRRPSNTAGRFGECSFIHLTVIAGFRRRASARAAFASSIFPSCA